MTVFLSCVVKLWFRSHLLCLLWHCAVGMSFELADSDLSWQSSSDASDAGSPM